MIDLMGQYSYKVDAKGRVALPPKFAKELSKELIVTLNPDKTCLLLYGMDRAACGASPSVPAFRR